ncbi:hypothetical protein C9374_008806 [Naegleria lovaniensis]|uniref:Uncharacterized protein n=1 Tax=Naegleria lovaniensis TaxID=51637 RepID=A0AA88GJQ8_NAELO|nr:uncharacterized protein C9374_008806 [Naegleria lovaniensis]KAG2377721.1 hypothetical protein C9374_008806 [Naegleria lovaniensis]
MLFHLILQPFNDRIAINCQHSALFKDQAFALLTFENIDVKKSYWKVSYSTLDIQYMTIKNSIWEENIVEIDDLSELPQVWIDIQYSTQRRSVFTLAAKPSIFISHSLLEKITFNSLRNSNISISCSQVIDSNFGNSKDLHEVWDNVEFTIEDSSILNSNVTLARFRHVTFHNVSFHETNMLAIIYTYDVLFQNVIAREGRFYSLLQSNGNLNIWESVFDSLDSIENFKHLFDIISTSPIDIDSSLFSNNKAPVMHLLDILAANIYYSNFLDNIGPCLAAEWNTFLVGSFIRIESVNFINNTCTDCEGSAAQLNFDSIEIVESYFQGNQALNGGALRINSAESQISKSVFLDNIASYKEELFIFLILLL